MLSWHKRPGGDLSWSHLEFYAIPFFIRAKSLQTKHATLPGSDKRVQGSSPNPAVVVLWTSQGWDLLPQSLSAWQCLDWPLARWQGHRRAAAPGLSLGITGHKALSSHSTAQLWARNWECCSWGEPDLAEIGFDCLNGFDVFWAKMMFCHRENTELENFRSVRCARSFFI